MLKIILDCDDVLYSTNELALERLNEELGTSYGLEDITKWGTISRELDCRLEYFKVPEFIRKLTVYDRTSEFLANLMDFSDVVLATSVPPCYVTARLNAIRRDFPMMNPNAFARTYQAGRSGCASGQKDQCRYLAERIQFPWSRIWQLALPKRPTGFHELLL